MRGHDVPVLERCTNRFASSAPNMADAVPKCVICTNHVGLDTVFCFLVDSNRVPAE
jgi:hypothetical protein